VIRAIEDLDESRNTKTPGMDSYQCYNSIAWIRDTKTGDPLLLFSGIVQKIHVYNVAKGAYVKTLTGHGSGIQEIVPHPTNASIFATSSDDNEVRLWNVDSKFEDSWCAVICHGEFGHTSTVYSVAFTKNGRYLMSGGRDTWVHLWALPEAHELGQLPEEKVRSRRIYYPHFSSADVHHDIVDCIRFYGDLIISRCVGFKVVIWAIDGFSSEEATPDPPTKHIQGQRTYSAFGSGLTVLYSFNHMKSHVQPCYYNRFNIFSSPTGKPVLAMGDLGEASLHFWDLLRLEQDKEESGWDGDPLEAMKPHETFTPYLDRDTKSSISFFRALDWSPDGKFSVAVYDGATLLLCWR
jgi:polycomb protein EED